VRVQDSVAVILEKAINGKRLSAFKTSPRMADIVLDELLSTNCRRQERDEAAKIGTPAGRDWKTLLQALDDVDDHL